MGGMGGMMYTRPKAGGPEEEYSARKIMKLNQSLGMYFHWITDTEQVAPYNNIEKNLYVDAKTYATIENSGEPEFTEAGALNVNKDSLPESSKGLQLDDVSGIWNCEGFDEEIAECSESGSGSPNPSDSQENSEGTGKHPCDTN